MKTLSYFLESQSHNAGRLCIAIVDKFGWDAPKLVRPDVHLQSVLMSQSNGFMDRLSSCFVAGLVHYLLNGIDNALSQLNPVHPLGLCFRDGCLKIAPVVAHELPRSVVQGLALAAQVSITSISSAVFGEINLRMSSHSFQLMQTGLSLRIAR